MSTDRFRGLTNGGRPRTGNGSAYEQLRARLSGQVQDLYNPQVQPQPDVDHLGRVTATPEQVSRALSGRREPYPESPSPTSSESPVEEQKKEPSNRSKKRHGGRTKFGGPGGDVYVNRSHPNTGGPRGRGR